MEKRDLYDEDKELTGKTILKGEKIPEGYYYLTVIVWIENSKNKFLIQRTSYLKYHMYATTGGHPKSGENSL